MSNTGTSSIIRSGFGRQTDPIVDTPDYDDYLTAATTVISSSTVNIPYRNPDDFPETGKQLLRLVPSAYGDNLNTPSGSDRPNPRDISNHVIHQDESTSVENTANATDMFWLWGQFIDHDFDLTPGGGDTFNISIPSGDAWFDPSNTGTQIIPFTRSQFDPSTGTGITPREQVNMITPEHDGTSIYGSITERAHWLRTFKNGKLKVGMGSMLPINDGTMENEGPSEGRRPFVAGDVRANENVGLLSMHTLWVREHNWWATRIKSTNKSLSDEEIYNRARIMVEGELQRITFNEFLPILLGKNAMPSYTGYDENVDAQISNEFSTAAFRLGHSLVSETVLRLRNDGSSIGNLTLREAFFAPQHYTNEGDIDYILRGFCKQKCQKLDAHIVTSLRNFLFGEPGQGGLDLASLNIQRGRDNGLPDYNTVRIGLGLAAKSTFADITTDSSLAAALSSAYSGDVSKIDLWVGGLCEDPVNGSQLGEVFHHIIRDQFTRIRAGDQHWYENRMTNDMIALVNRTTLAQIIQRNTRVNGIPNECMKM